MKLSLDLARDLPQKAVIENIAQHDVSFHTGLALAVFEKSLHYGVGNGAVVAHRLEHDLIHFGGSIGIEVKALPDKPDDVASLLPERAQRAQVSA